MREVGPQRRLESGAAAGAAWSLLVQAAYDAMVAWLLLRRQGYRWTLKWKDAIAINSPGICWIPPNWGPRREPAGRMVCFTFGI